MDHFLFCVSLRICNSIWTFNASLVESESVYIVQFRNCLGCLMCWWKFHLQKAIFRNNADVYLTIHSAINFCLTSRLTSRIIFHRPQIVSPPSDKRYYDLPNEIDQLWEERRDSWLLCLSFLLCGGIPSEMFITLLIHHTDTSIQVLSKDDTHFGEVECRI